MESIQLDITRVSGFVTTQEIARQESKGRIALSALQGGTAEGADFLGWLTWPTSFPGEELDRIEACAARLKKAVDTLVVIGIGGSYLGSKAVIEALTGSFDHQGSVPPVIFAGHQLSEEYAYELNQYLQDKSFGICVISKSGTTTEPAIAFRLLRNLLEKQVGKAEAASRIVAITDKSRGALRTLAKQEKYETFVIPDNVGGRFSVLTPVGLLPVALAGFDIRALLDGAAAMQQRLSEEQGGMALTYAAVRNALYEKGYSIEITVNYNPRLHYVTEWWKQLYGESEGKGHKGIFPAGVDFSTDLHSLGQYIQDGPRNLFETTLSVENSANTVLVPEDAQNLDQLNFLTGKSIHFINKMAEQGTRMAHTQGGVPNMRILIPRLNEHCLGQLFYFYELGCGISGGILGVNAFDQPGVEAYKKNMFALLGKPLGL